MFYWGLNSKKQKECWTNAIKVNKSVVSAASWAAMAVIVSTTSWTWSWMTRRRWTASLRTGETPDHHVLWMRFASTMETYIFLSFFSRFPRALCVWFSQTDTLRPKNISAFPPSHLSPHPFFVVVVSLLPHPKQLPHVTLVHVWRLPLLLAVNRVPWVGGHSVETPR